MKRKDNSSRSVPKLALTRTEAAEALGVTTTTVDRLAKRGLLRPSRATRRPLYSVGELNRFLEETARTIDLGPEKGGAL